MLNTEKDDLVLGPRMLIYLLKKRKSTRINKVSMIFESFRLENFLSKNMNEINLIENDKILYFPDGIEIKKVKSFHLIER